MVAIGGGAALNAPGGGGVAAVASLFAAITKVPATLSPTRVLFVLDALTISPRR